MGVSALRSKLKLSNARSDHITQKITGSSCEEWGENDIPYRQMHTKLRFFTSTAPITIIIALLLIRYFLKDFYIYSNHMG